ncbi:hypothetical protein V3C99_009506, partial [Haemonchus contortus]
MNERL